MTIQWTDQLGVLLDLQKIDSQIFHIEKELAQKPLEKKSLQDAFESKKGSLKASEQALKDLQVRQKDRENDLASKETNIKKYQQQQSLVKTNQEYSALTKEIGGLKADCSLVEEEILKTMDLIEAQKKAVEKDRADLAVEEKKLKAELAVIDAAVEAKRQESAGLAAERQKFAPLVEKNLLAQYEKILKKKDGTALVYLVGEACGGCNMAMTPHNVDLIRQHDKMMNCESCGRILYEKS